jgi:hypothetical protein
VQEGADPYLGHEASNGERRVEDYGSEEGEERSVKHEQFELGYEAAEENLDVAGGEDDDWGVIS